MVEIDVVDMKCGKSACIFPDIDLHLKFLKEKTAEIIKKAEEKQEKKEKELKLKYLWPVGAPRLVSLSFVLCFG